ncbi:two-component system, response regulator YesN [Paenibacillus sp. UNCCL117]|uniref:response regulator transcription factor n=1 Tax=unclassified Paenibacillus TaxID=185978 RepID=UPI00088C9DDA|nr:MULTISPECIES: response regulator [unclassified Paenibacillus]SDC16265.1 two-component system, response regulator YesN [Paenibacillus sp. cl123]SFW17736.1 two-component system, response regulator YesN [Paenibacillus sp. UNCCL117]
MFRLVIIDDEPTVRHGLMTYFEWDKYGIEVVGEADDGDVGLELIERLKPDLVLTDVRMPHMDGIRLSHEIKARFPAMKIVFVSGHDDADYLKSALKVNAVDYIFKPVDRLELAAVVERVVNELQEAEQERTYIVDMQVKLTESMPLLREKFLMSLIRDGIKHPGRIQDRLDFLGLDLPLEAVYWTIVVKIDDSAQVAAARSERDQQLLSYSILNIVQELIGKHMRGYVFENRGGEFVGILRMDEEDAQEELLLAVAEDIRDSLLKWLKISVTIGVGERIAELASLPQSYYQAQEAADQRWYLGKNHVISIDHLQHDNEHVYRFETAQAERIYSLIKSADQEALHAELDDVFTSLARNRMMGFAYGRNVSLQLIVQTNRLLQEFNMLGAEMEHKERDLWERMFKQERIADLRAIVEEHLMQVCKRIEEKRRGKPKNVIERIRALIEQRYADNLQINDIAKEVFLSPTYMCLLYKQETGETINEFMTKVRIEKAKELLSDPRNKFYEVCFQVGYADPSYFSKLFKKYVGLTPSAYRDQMI